MNTPTFRTIFVLLAIAASALLPVSAQAAAPATIHEDAADGSIDGDYSMSDMRAANQAATSVQREYYGWDDVYIDYVRGGSPAAPLAAPSSRSGGGGGGSRSSDSGSKGNGPASSDAPSSKGAGNGSGDGAAGASSADDSSGGGASGDSTVTASAANDDVTVASDEGGGFPFAILLAAIPLLVLAIGAWRTTRTRAARARTHAAQPD